MLDVLRRVGELTLAEAGDRVLAGLNAAQMLEDLRAERRAARIRVNGEERWIDAADAGLYRDALGVAPPGGLPASFLEDVPDALSRLLRRYAATHGPFTAAEVKARYGIDASAALRELEREDVLVRGELRPGGQRAGMVRSRGAAAAAPRLAGRAAQGDRARRAARAGPLPPRLAGRRPPPASGAGIDRLREALVPLQGWRCPAEVWERDVLPRRVGAYSPAWMDQLCASGEVVWIGAGALGRGSGRVALYFREDLPRAWVRPRRTAPTPVPAGEAHQAVRQTGSPPGPASSPTCSSISSSSPEEIQEALWDLAWAGVATNDAFAPLRAPRLTLARAQREQTRRITRRGGRFGAARRRAGASAAGSGSLVTDRAAAAHRDRSRLPPAGDRRAAAGALRHPHP